MDEEGWVKAVGAAAQEGRSIGESILPTRQAAWGGAEPEPEAQPQ